MEALDVARYLVARFNYENVPIDNAQLQKILYFIKGYGLAYFEDGVIEDDFEAWSSGAVCPSVYEKYEEWEDNKILMPNDEKPKEIIPTYYTEPYDIEKIRFINAITNQCLKLGHFGLSMFMSVQKPYTETREGLGVFDMGGVISSERMKEYYSKAKEKYGN